MKILLVLSIVSLISVECNGQLNPEGCGMRLSDFSNKIVGGNKVSVGDWGWQVGIEYQSRYICGGVLINDLWVVTAAHCVFGRFKPSDYSLNLGYNDRLVANPWSIKRSITKVIPHWLFPGAAQSSLQHDIALLKLASSVTYSKYIVPVCVPTIADIDYSGRTSYATGWGVEYFGSLSLSRELQEVELPILTDEECKIKYKLTDTRYSFCAGETGGNKDTCNGDSGGPLIVQDYNGLARGNWTLAGLTSHGKGCGDGGAYTRVSFYANWILSQIAING